MTNEFIKRVLNEGIVDTRKYRYVEQTNRNGKTEIKRIEIDKLDTTAALTDWVIVKTL